MTRILLLALMLLSACADREMVNGLPASMVTRFSADTLATYDLSGRIFTSSDSLVRPFFIAVGERQVYVGDTGAKFALLTFDRVSGQLVSLAGRRGRSDREISRLWQIDFKPGSDSGWEFDIRSATMHFFNGDSLTNRTVRLTGDVRPMTPVQIAQDSIAAAGMYEEGRLALYGPGGEFSHLIGSDPPGDPSLSASFRQQLSTGRLRTNPGGTRLVLGIMHSDRIEIFNTNGLLHRVRGPGFHEPDYTVHTNDDGESWLSLNGESTFGYVGPAVTNKLILGLYSGRTLDWINEMEKRGPPAGQVVVFTWTGRPVAVLNIDDGAPQIGVSADGGHLYAIHFETCTAHHALRLA